MEHDITPEPTEAEREAIRAALAEEEDGEGSHGAYRSRWRAAALEEDGAGP